MSGAGSAQFSDPPAPDLLVETTRCPVWATCWFVVRARMLPPCKWGFNRQTVTAKRQVTRMSFPRERWRSGKEAAPDAIIAG
jgi:hypothetical protein